MFTTTKFDLLKGVLNYLVCCGWFVGSRFVGSRFVGDCSVSGWLLIGCVTIGVYYQLTTESKAHPFLFEMLYCFGCYLVCVDMA